MRLTVAMIGGEVMFGWCGSHRSTETLAHDKLANGEVPEPATLVRVPRRLADELARRGEPCVCGSLYCLPRPRHVRAARSGPGASYVRNASPCVGGELA